MNDAEPAGSKPSIFDELEDPLLDLFQRSSEFTVENFRSELRKQRNAPTVGSQAVVSV
jgi:hypothetical protein